jgi:hypothetical protein
MVQAYPFLERGNDFKLMDFGGAGLRVLFYDFLGESVA